MPQWFISHPSGGPKHTPAFFAAINQFASSHPKIRITLPHASEEDVQLTKDAIEASDLVLVEVSIASTGSGIELGWANAAGKPIIAFNQGGTEPSPAIKFITQEIHTYVTEEHIVDVLKKL